MLIAIDYDDTYTADPALWAWFIKTATARGHSFVCVTGRKVMPEFGREPPLPAGVPVVLAGDTYKRTAALKAGYRVNIWIDDMPEMICEGRILQWQEPAPGGKW